jgi:2,5-diamino-6-(ribosylamino)-4(3H)-pyrimidinone 5'-phosphate reductase
LNRPYVILNAAVSLDGKIATRLGESELSSLEDWERVHRLRCRVDAIMIGMNTVLVDNPKLTIKCGRSPLKIVVDSLARTPPTARLLTHRGESKVMIAVGGKAPAHRIKALRKAGAEVFRAGRRRRVNLKILMEELHRRGVGRLLVEGGGNLNWSLIREGLVDEVQVALTPVIIGGRKAVSLVEGEGFGRISEAQRLKLLSVEKVGFNLLLKFKCLPREGKP